MDAALALDQQLVDVGGRPADVGVRGAHVAFLMAAHAHASAADTPDIAAGEGDVHQGGDGAVVVVAPDHALLVGEHRASTLALLRLGDPVGRRADLLDREAGDGGGLLQAGAVRRQHLRIARGRGLDEGAVDPALGVDVGHPGVVERQVAARRDRQVQHILAARLGLAGIHRHGPARIDDHDPRRGMRLVRQLLALLGQRAAAQVGHPVIEEVVGLGLQGVGAAGDDGVAELGVLIAVVQLADAHVAGRVDLAVVGRAVVDADVLDLHGGEVELPGAPGVLVAAAGAAVIEGGDEDPVLALLVDHPLGDRGDQ